MFKTAIATVFLSCLALGTFALPAHAGSYQLLHSFGSIPDGHDPQSGLLDVNGTLYGTTYFGGNLDFGTVFAFDPATNTETVLRYFDLGTNGGKLASSLIEVGGVLYGAATEGGVGHHGTVFSLDPTNNAFTLLYAFSGSGKGRDPGGLVYSRGRLFGTTANGPGSLRYGTVFSSNLATGATKTVHNFTGADGANPSFGLVEVQGTLYGTTPLGGAANAGLVFSLDPKTGAESTVYAFTGSTDGKSPSSGLINVGGMLFGTTYAGGAAGAGTVFSVNPTTGAETVIYNFQAGNDGASPQAALLDVHGKLYGTTADGGASRHGTLFFVDPAKGTEKVVHEFKGGRDGEYPVSGLINAGGVLYGTTPQGGANGTGTIFSYTP